MGGYTFTEDQYVFPSRTDKKTATHTITLDTPATGSIGFKFVKQVGMRITLHVATNPAGINSIMFNNKTNAPVYDLTGRRRSNNAKGIVIIGDKKVLKSYY